MLTNVLRRILILLRIPIKLAAVVALMLDVAGIARPARDVGAHERTLRLGSSGHRVPRAGDDLARLPAVARRARQVGGVVGCHNGRGLGEPFVVVEVVLAALIGPWDGGNRVHFACIVGDRGSLWRHLGEGAALVRILANHFVCDVGVGVELSSVEMRCGMSRLVIL